MPETVFHEWSPKNPSFLCLIISLIFSFRVGFRKMQFRGIKVSSIKTVIHNMLAKGEGLVPV